MTDALKKANAWEFISKMEKGVKTYVGSGGTQLSGGHIYVLRKGKLQ